MGEGAVFFFSPPWVLMSLLAGGFGSGEEYWMARHVKKSGLVSCEGLEDVSVGCFVGWVNLSCLTKVRDGG